MEPAGVPDIPLLIRFSVGGALGHMQKVYTLSGLRKQKKKCIKSGKKLPLIYEWKMPENACLHIRTPNKRPYFHWLLIFYQGNFSPCFSIAFPIFFCVKQIGKLLGIQRLSSDTKKPQKGINFA